LWVFLFPGKSEACFSFFLETKNKTSKMFGFLCLYWILCWDHELKTRNPLKRSLLQLFPENEKQNIKDILVSMFVLD